MNDKGKVIVLDWSIFMFRSIFAWRHAKDLPVTWYCMNMIVSTLQKIGVEPIDTIIVACDGKDNWRKELDKNYKADRKAFRESFEDIDWEEMFRKFDVLLKTVDECTNWHKIKIDRLEADDIGAVVSKYYSDRPVILCSYDGDWQQMWQYDNVKIWSILLKGPKGKGAYKIKPNNFNAYMLLSKKIEKEVADNLISTILNEKDYEKRMALVNLLELPEFVENQIKEVLDNLQDKKVTREFPMKSIRAKLDGLYNNKDKVVTYKQCVARKEKKRKRRKK